jgi:hypothetical protein
MKSILILLLLCVIILCTQSDETKQTAKKLQIGIKKKVENCVRTSKKGDSLSMHYTGKLGIDLHYIKILTVLYYHDFYILSRRNRIR